MKRTIAKGALASLAFAVALPFAGTICAQEGERPVAVKTDGMPAHVRSRVEERAQQGQTSVIRYLNRTRSVHQLRPEDVIKQKEITVEAKKGSIPKKVAEKAPDDRK
jgi:hypothetical protein